ncbi:MAG: hypothetical protein GY927_00410, partial [bacterium]|nr:hypothetical protein [bacterium]
RHVPHTLEHMHRNFTWQPVGLPRRYNAILRSPYHLDRNAKSAKGLNRQLSLGATGGDGVGNELIAKVGDGVI